MKIKEQECLTLSQQSPGLCLFTTLRISETAYRFHTTSEGVGKSVRLSDSDEVSGAMPFWGRGAADFNTSQTAGLVVICLPQVWAEHLILDVSWRNTTLDQRTP
jgi:hypothetical protein